MAVPEQEKICSKCKNSLPTSHFYKNSHGRDGLYPSCKRCYFRAYKERKDVFNRLHVVTLKRKVFAMYGGDCYCCGESDFRFLTLDHINNDGRKHKTQMGGAFYRWLRNNGFPQDLGLRVSCWNCNCARHFNGGVCPHETDRNLILLPQVA